MAKSQKSSVGRRGFLKNAAAGAAAGAAALVVAPPILQGQTQGTHTHGNGAGTRP